jgi:hypothetical protein
MPADLMPDHTLRLLIFEQAQRELAQAETVAKVIDIRNKAIGLVAYAKEAKSRQLALEAKQICIFAERRLGQMMKEQKKTVGLNSGGRPKTGLSDNPVSFKPTLAEAGIDKNLAHRARGLAAMSEKEFKEQVAGISAAMWRPRKQRSRQPSLSVLGIADRCVASVRKTVERATAEMRRGHAARPKFEHLFAALAKVITDLERETLPDTERPRAKERKAA